MLPIMMVSLHYIGVDSRTDTGWGVGHATVRGFEKMGNVLY
jgi:hypothetical protein